MATATTASRRDLRVKEHTYLWEGVDRNNRQLRGESTNQVPGARVGLVISGPMVTPVSSMLLGTGDTR